MKHIAMGAVLTLIVFYFIILSNKPPNPPKQEEISVSYKIDECDDYVKINVLSDTKNASNT